MEELHNELDTRTRFQNYMPQQSSDEHDYVQQTCGNYLGCSYFSQNVHQVSTDDIRYDVYQFYE